MTATTTAGALTAADLGRHVHVPRLKRGGILRTVAHSHVTGLGWPGEHQHVPHDEPVVVTDQEVPL